MEGGGDGDRLYCLRFAFCLVPDFSYVKVMFGFPQCFTGFPSFLFSSLLVPFLLQDHACLPCILIVPLLLRCTLHLLPLNDVLLFSKVDVALLC
jgi:hypothetical protein